jgi:hypothetical protein
MLIAAPVVAQAQRPEPDRPRGDRYAVPDDRDGPSYQYRYGRDDDDREFQEYRRWTPSFSCSGSYDRDQCERRLREVTREEAKWRREAREREEKFQREMAEREQKFRAKEMKRWRDHRRDLAEKWGRFDRD